MQSVERKVRGVFARATRFTTWHIREYNINRSVRKEVELRMAEWHYGKNVERREDHLGLTGFI